ncbi:MAG: hypothetical protein OEZ36_06085 [Spirochaetota bacterium]|nr:hypothetical protein [Spirochaetota bacterium]
MDEEVVVKWDECVYLLDTLIKLKKDFTIEYQAIQNKVKSIVIANDIDNKPNTLHAIFEIEITPINIKDKDKLQVQVNYFFGSDEVKTPHIEMPHYENFITFLCKFFGSQEVENIIGRVHTVEKSELDKKIVSIKKVRSWNKYWVILSKLGDFLKPKKDF